MHENELAISRLKIERAKDHFATLEAELLAWTQQNQQASLVRWSVIVGDCVGNLRSALDNLVYAIAIYQTGRNPPPGAKSLGFPIIDNPAKFHERKKRIKWLSQAVQDEIEKLQPYNRPHPQLRPLLKLLSEINNRSKHTTLNVVAAARYSNSIKDVNSPPDSNLNELASVIPFLIGEVETVHDRLGAVM